MRPWLQNAALAAPSGFEAARISSQWPDMPGNSQRSPLPSDFDLRRAARHRRPGRARLGADERRRHGADDQDAPPQQGAQGNPICIRLEGQLATIDRGAGTGDPAKDEQIRRYQEAPPSSRPNSIASRCRPSAWAAKARASSRCSTASRRNAVRSTTRSSRCAPISTRSPPASSACAAAASAAPTAKTSAARC